MSDYLTSVAKKLQYVIAACIIIAAVLIGASRFLTPLFNKHRSDFENYASQLLSVPITIDKVSFSWYRYQPVVRFDQITIFNKESKSPILQVQKARIFFSIPKSLWQRKLVMSGIMIVGTDINLREKAGGEISVQGFPSLGGFKSQPFQRETKFQDILAWLSQEPRLILQDIDLRYTALSGKQQFITVYDLSFLNTNTQHSILGKALLHQEIPTDFTLALQWQGTKLDLAQIKAKIYLYFSGLSLPQWIKGLSWQGWQVREGYASAKVWATWNHGGLRKVQTTFALFNMNLFSATDHSTHKINRLSGNVGWKHQGNQQVLAGDDILLDLPTHLWPVTNFYVALTPDQKGMLSPKTVTFSYADLRDVRSFLFSSKPLLSQSVQKMLIDLQLSGALQNTTIKFFAAPTDWQHTILNTNFSQLSFTALKTFPGVQHFSGALKWDGTHGDLAINTSRAAIQYNAAFSQPINIQQLFGNVHFQQTITQDWEFKVSSLQILNDDMAANLHGMLTLPKNATPKIDMNANLTLQKADHLTRYLPMRLFDADLVTWLQQAFLSGEIKSANAFIRGDLTRFPFDQGGGEFSVAVLVKNMNFRYAPDWPIMQHVDGKLNLLGRKLLIDISNANILNIPLTNVHAEIPSLGKTEQQILQVNSKEIHTNFTEAIKLVEQSPLQKTLGKLFTNVNLSGPTTLNLGLTVPLRYPEKTLVQGSMTLENTQMTMLPWHFALNNLNGMMQFTRDTLTAQDIRGELFNQPLKLQLKTRQKTQNLSIIQADFATQLDLSSIESWLKLPLSQVAQGKTAVQGQADFSLQTPIQIRLNSQLAGVSVNLPDQYGKKAGETKNFSAELNIDEKEPLRIKLNYGALVDTALILEHQNEKLNLQAANVHFGKGNADWPTHAGLYITGNFAELDVDNMTRYINETNNRKNLPNIKLQGIDIEIESLKFAGSHLNQLRIRANRDTNQWLAVVNSPDVSGQLRIPESITRQSVLTATFERLQLHLQKNEKKISSLINVKTLPTINFSANNVTYNDMVIGQLAFKMIPSGNGTLIRGLHIVSTQMNLQANGDWVQINNEDVTHLQGNVNTSNVSRLLNNFAFDVHNFVSSSGRLNFNLHWRDAPYAPSVANMNGSATLEMGKGRIVDIGQASGAKMDIGRLLSIFSLQTIPRRLTGDFSDLFQKGYSFDSVRGNFLLQNGDVFTNNMRIDGPVARVDINGRIGLNNKDYDFILSVTPSVTSLTSSIPVAAATFGIINPLAGLAALAVNSVVGTQVSKIITYHYAVTGPWDNPTWKQITQATNTKSQSGR